MAQSFHQFSIQLEECQSSSRNKRAKSFAQFTFLSFSFPPLLPVLEVLPLDGEGALFSFANLRLPPDDSLIAPKIKLS